MWSTYTVQFGIWSYFGDLKNFFDSKIDFEKSNFAKIDEKSINFDHFWPFWSFFAFFGSFGPFF